MQFLFLPFLLYRRTVVKCFALWIALISLPFAGFAQITITNGVQKYGSLTSTTVTMSNKCELWVTNSSTPLSGCTINLNSQDAWLFFQNTRPSVVTSTYLSQVKINGAAATSGSNCRVVEYAMGTVVVPHASSITPLQVFNGPNFLGDAMSMALYTYYTNTALGSFRWNIESFKLKRGYMATFAQFPDGTGVSKVYVAQDSDLDIGAMPANLDHQCSFARVVPWRWTGKKGWGGGVDGNLTLVDALWNYDWGNGANSTANVEYIPMQWGGGYSTGINGKQNSSEVLGYNEPDQSNQANMSVATAVAYWPYMMQSGLRVGAPAVSDSGVSGQGVSWLYSFMQQATNLGYRIDYVPVHAYKCGYSATQLSNYLAGIYQTVGKPIWLTEFNYGADWCANDTDTQSTEATMIASYTAMLESCPFVERYAIYQWFGTNREMVVNGVLTPAGTNYLKQQSNIGYKQEVFPGGSRGIAQYRFEGTVDDSSGYANNAFAIGAPGYAAGQNGQAALFDGASSYLQLPTTVGQSGAFTFAAWVYWNGGSNWQRIIDFGNDTSHYFFLTPSSGGNTLRFAINNGSGEQLIETAAMPIGQWFHVAVTLTSGSAKLYTNGVLAASSASFTIVPSNFLPQKNYVGKSQFSADPMFNGLLDEVQIADTVLSATQISSLMTDTPPQFTSSTLSGGNAAQLSPYAGSIAGTATDADPGDTLTYSKASGPAWLNVATDGTLSGTPTSTDAGTNRFTVRVTDAAGASAYALLTITIPFAYGNGAWFMDATGLWSDNSKWTGLCPAGGAGLTANFSVVDISANRTVTLDSSRSIGTMRFADYSGSQTWTLASSGGSVLTLDSGSAASPSILVGESPSFSSSNALTISAPLAGTNGLTKNGWGNLYLTGANPLSGTLNIDTGSTSNYDGIVSLGAAASATNLTTINIRNNNNGSSTLQLSGGVVSPAAISLSGRNTNAVAIQNVSASNVISGGLTLNVGGGYYVFQSDSGTLNLGGILSSAATGTRNLTFQGAGDHFISGGIQNGSATVSVTKQDGGTITFGNINSFSGALNFGGGALKVATPLALQNITVYLGCASTNALKFGTLSAASIGSLSGIADVWLTNSPLSPLTLTNGANNSSSAYSGALRGSGNFVKAGTGILTLGATNAYTGATIVAGGKLNFGTASNVIASLQPTLWFNFDAASGAVVTNLGTGGWSMNGSIIGNGAYVTNTGRFGKALFIDGNGSSAATNIVLVPNKVVDTSAAGSWTVGYWIKTTTAGAVIMYQGDGGWSSSGQTTYLLNANSGSTAGTFAGAVRWAGGFLTGSTPLNDGNWHFITLVDTSGTETIYVDGNANSTTSTMGLALASGANQIWIGGSPDTDAGAVKISGMIDEVCMFPRALSVAEIRTIYTNAATVGKLPGASAVSVASGATLDLSGISQTIGTLSDAGTGGIVTNSGAAATLAVTGASGSATFSGTMADSLATPISLTKSGGSTQILAGNNTYRGTTSVSGGSLLVNGSIGSGAVTLSGGTLGGNGILGGAVTVSGGVFAPGMSIGQLTVNNNVILQPGGTTVMEISHDAATNDSLVVSGTLQYGGTLTINNLSGTLGPGDSFKLFTAPTVSGGFAATNLPSLNPGYGWNFDALSGILSVIQTVATNPTSVSFAVSGNSLTLTWPPDHIGWHLQAQTNDLTTGLGTNWVDVPNTAATNEVTLPMDATAGSVFYRLVYP